MRNKRLCKNIGIITAVIAAISAAIFFIRRKLKSRYSAFAVVAALVMCVMFTTAFVTTAYAKPFPECEEYAGDNCDCTEESAEYQQAYSPDSAEAGITITIPALPIDPAPEDEPEPATEPQTLTPPGNLTLIDDFSGDSAADKQFLTVVTRNGHFFYIIVDRAGDRQNVHFLNQVDEYSLWAILDEDAPRPMPQPDPIPEVIPEPEQEPEESGGIGGLLIMLVLIGAIGGGAYYYFKVLKPGQGATKTDASQIDEFVFDDDEDDFGNPTGEYDHDYTNTDEDAEPDYTAGYSADHEDDMPDSTVATDFNHDSADDSLPFESAEFGKETPESEDK